MKFIEWLKIARFTLLLLTLGITIIWSLIYSGV